VCPIYPNQRLALVGSDGDSASHAVPGWPFGGDGAVLLINDGPDAPLEIQVRPKGAFDCSYDAQAGYYTVKSKGARLFLKVARVGASLTQTAPPARPASIWKQRSKVQDDSDLTAVPHSHRPAPHQAEADATYAPFAQQRVSLAGLALPRLSRYRDTGAQALEIGLDAALGVAAQGKEAVIRFAVDAADELHVITSAGRQRVTAPSTFSPVDGASVELLAVAPEMAERYCAMLRLARPLMSPVASGARFVFGRSAFSFEAAGGGYKIGRLSATQALFHLDEQMRFVAAIGETAADKPYLLPAGHHLVAGHYVLRFDA
jgi:hypothetical protein